MTGARTGCGGCGLIVSTATAEGRESWTGSELIIVGRCNLRPESTRLSGTNTAVHVRTFQLAQPPINRLQQGRHFFVAVLALVTAAMDQKTGQNYECQKLQEFA